MSTGWRKRGGGMNNQSDNIEQSVSVGEPVMRIDWWPNADTERYITNMVAWEHLPVGTLLYTTPQQRKPLTDEQIADIVIEMNGNEPPALFWKDLTRAIEAAHGIRPSDFKE